MTLDREGEGLRVRIPEDAGIPADRTNLVWRAAEAFLSRRSLSGGITVTLTKRIPVAGGLAGGSTDAAGVLRLLNRIAGADVLSPEELLAVAQTLGADVPFCLLRPGGAMRTQGIGEVLTPVPALPGLCNCRCQIGRGRFHAVGLRSAGCTVRRFFGQADGDRTTGGCDAVGSAGGRP